MAAVSVHVGDVCLELDVGVEVAYMSKGLFVPSRMKKSSILVTRYLDYL
jgi:hypothetical protein